jgi:hypothetical protein
MAEEEAGRAPAKLADAVLGEAAFDLGLGMEWMVAYVGAALFDRPVISTLTLQQQERISSRAFELMDKLIEQARGGEDKSTEAIISEIRLRTLIRGREMALRNGLHAEMGSRDYIFHHAQRGDWAALASYIRDGRRITSQMRPFLADILDGKIFRPNKKISKAKTKSRNYELLRFIVEARARGEKDIPRKAEEKFGRTWRQLQKVLAAERGGALETRARQMLHYEWVTKAFLTFHGWDPKEEEAREPRRGVPKYEVSDVALTPHTLT